MCARTIPSLSLFLPTALISSFSVHTVDDCAFQAVSVVPDTAVNITEDIDIEFPVLDDLAQVRAC